MLLLHLPNSHGALHVQVAMVEAMSRLPQTLRRTLTWDQGQEMATMQPSRQLPSSRTTSATPTRPGNEGRIKNTNGLLRQYSEEHRLVRLPP